MSQPNNAASMAKLDPYLVRDWLARVDGLVDTPAKVLNRPGVSLFRLS
jgi:hypothetical protein